MSHQPNYLLFFILWPVIMAIFGIIGLLIWYCHGRTKTMPGRVLDIGAPISKVVIQNPSLPHAFQPQVHVQPAIATAQHLVYNPQYQAQPSYATAQHQPQHQVQPPTANVQYLANQPQNQSQPSIVKAQLKLDPINTKIPVQSDDLPMSSNSPPPAYDKWQKF